MKILDRVTNWTHRNLWWVVPFCVVMPFVLWWWNAHIDQIGHWLWLAIHGQKADDLLAAATVVGGILMMMGVVVLALHDCFGRGRK